jgi:hypothetical protein
MPRKPKTTDQAKERASLTSHLQQMYRDEVLPVDCILLEYMGHNAVLEDLFRQCSKTVAGAGVELLREGSSGTVAPEEAWEEGQEHPRESKKRRR